MRGRGSAFQATGPKYPSGMDTQQIEIIGRGLLTAHLIEGGVEVARPERDRGVDLIAYVDTLPGGFAACPIQMKAYTDRPFAIWRKYEKTPGLLIVHVWRALDPAETTILALTQAESLAIGDSMGWTSTPSWRKGMWRSPKPSADLLELLEPYRMTPDGWANRIRAATKTRDERGVAASWLSDAASSVGDELQFQVESEGAIAQGPHKVPAAELVSAVGQTVQLVVRNHDEGLGPKGLEGRVTGLVDVMSRPYGRLRPAPGIQLDVRGRSVVVPVMLIEAITPMAAGAETEWPDAYSFAALTPSDDVTGEEYKSLFPHA